MSNEPVKLELECAPYSHHHHHHHLPHHNPHLQHHHNPHTSHHHHHHDSVTISPPHHHQDEEEEDDDDDDDDEEEEHELIENDEEKHSERDETKNANELNDEHRVLLACSHEGHINATTTTATTTNPGDSTTHNDSQTKHLTQLENVIDHPPNSNTQTSLATDTIAVLSSTLENVSTASSSSTSGTSSDSSESDDEDAYEQDEDDDDEAEDEEDEGDDDDEDDEDEYDDDESEDDSFGIVDPVGHQVGNDHLQHVTMSGGDCDETNPMRYVQINCNNANGESNSDDDVSFDSDLGDTVHINDKSTTPDLVDSERMLEVTRKLVRSTELDPDRDLRKQMHNNTLDSSNTPVNCLSPTQHYEHHHMSLNHHLESQPKSYHHSQVQPNAIQMSTTSLRMLDLNDDTESDSTVNSLEVKYHQYENSAEISQAGLTQHDYTSQTYGHHSDNSNSNSSQSSMTSEDSVNSSSQSNDSTGDLSGVSMLETSLYATTDYYYSHDSGVALFSPRSNKRSSSSIGLDDEMDIDHLTDLTSSNQFNSGSSMSDLNHCKKLRKREIID